MIDFFDEIERSLKQLCRNYEVKRTIFIVIY